MFCFFSYFHPVIVSCLALGVTGSLGLLPGVSGEQTLKMQKHIHTVGHFTLGSSSNRPVHKRTKPVGSSWSNISTFHWLDLRSRKQIIQFQFCLFFCFFFVSGGSGWNCNVNKEAWNFGLRPPSCLSIPSSHRFFQVWAKGPFQKLGVSRQSTPT